MDVATKQPRDKRAKFIQLAQKRMSNAIKTMRLVGQLGNRNSYEFAEADVKKIVAALQAEVDTIKAKMTTPAGNKSDVGFIL